MEWLILFGLAVVVALMRVAAWRERSGNGDGLRSTDQEPRHSRSPADWVGPAGRYHVNPDRWFATDTDLRPRRRRSRSLSEAMPPSCPNGTANR